MLPTYQKPRHTTKIIISQKMSTQSKLSSQLPLMCWRSSEAPTMYVWEVLPILLNLLQHLWFEFSLGPCRLSSHSFLKIFAVCLLWSFFCEGKMSKTNQHVCTLLTNSSRWAFFPPRLPENKMKCCFSCVHLHLTESFASYGEPWCRRSTVLLCPSQPSDVFTFHCPFLHQWQQWQGRI